MYYPAIITLALFAGILVSDIFSGKRANIPEHLVLGLISVSLMAWLSIHNAEIVAWGLLMIPMFILAITFIFVMFDVKLAPPPAATTALITTAPVTTTPTTTGVASNAATTTAPTTITPSACTPQQSTPTALPPNGTPTTVTPSTTC